MDLLEIESNYKGLGELIDQLEQLPPSIRTAYVKICELEFLRDPANLKDYVKKENKKILYLK